MHLKSDMCGRHRTYSQIVLSLVGCLMGLDLAGAQTSDFTASGMLRLTQPGVSSDVRELGFTIDVKNDMWQLAFQENGVKHTYGSDGVSVYTYLQDPNLVGWDGKPVSFTNGVRDRPYAAGIENGRYPHFGYAFAKLLCLAFVPGVVETASDSDSFPVPWSNPLKDPEALIYESRFQFHESDSSTIEEIEFVVTKKSKKNFKDHPLLGIESISMLRKNRERLGGFPNGFVGARYSLTGATNLLNQTVPLGFEMTRYTVGGAVLEKYNAKVETVSRCQRETFRPPVPKAGLSVGDFRFKDERLDFIAYNLKASDWLEKDDPKLLALYKDKTLNPPQRYSTQDGTWALFRRWVGMTIVIVIILALPAAVILRRAKKKA